MAFRPLFVTRGSKSQTDEDSFCVRSETLQDALTKLEAKRQGKRIIPVVPVQKPDFDDHVNLADVSNLMLGISSNGSNNTLDTLNSSFEMLTHEQAAKLSPTNAPIMKPHSLKKPMSVKSL